MNQEVVIFIGLMEWSEEESNLKPKRGKRLVSRDAPCKVLIEKAVEKWKSYNSNLYEEGEDYVLLVDNGQEALFLPGPRKEFFSLCHYQFKRITLYLCLAREFYHSQTAGLDCDAPDIEDEDYSSHKQRVGVPPRRKWTWFPKARTMKNV